MNVTSLISPAQAAAESIVSGVGWENHHLGYCCCPGEHRHTTATRSDDCRLYLDGMRLECWLSACLEARTALEHLLRVQLCLLDPDSTIETARNSVCTTAAGVF